MHANEWTYDGNTTPTTNWSSFSVTMTNVNFTIHRIALKIMWNPTITCSWVLIVHYSKLNFLTTLEERGVNFLKPQYWRNRKFYWISPNTSKKNRNLVRITTEARPKSILNHCWNQQKFNWIIPSVPHKNAPNSIEHHHRLNNN